MPCFILIIYFFNIKYFKGRTTLSDNEKDLYDAAYVNY